jgi:hypothetical protein
MAAVNTVSSFYAQLLYQETPTAIGIELKGEVAVSVADPSTIEMTENGR